MDPSTLTGNCLAESSLVVINKLQLGLPNISLLAAVGAMSLLQKNTNPFRRGNKQAAQKNQYRHPATKQQQQKQFSLIPRLGLPIVTLTVVASIAVVFHYQSTGAIALGKYSLCPWRVLRKKEYYRAVTHAFVHADKEHLVMNIAGAFLFGRDCESAYGSLRIVEATVWALVLENIIQLGLAKQTVFPIPGASSSKAMMHAHMVGFSGILNFWLGMGFSRKVWLNMLYVILVVTREVMHYSVKRGSIAHISGAISGMLYSLFILDRFTIPKPWLQAVEKQLPIPRWLYVPTPFEKRWYI